MSSVGCKMNQKKNPVSRIRIFRDAFGLLDPIQLYYTTKREDQTQVDMLIYIFSTA